MQFEGQWSRVVLSEKVTYEQRWERWESHTRAGKAIPGGGNSQCKGPGACLRDNKEVRGTGVE